MDLKGGSCPNTASHFSRIIRSERLKSIGFFEALDLKTGFEKALNLFFGRLHHILVEAWYFHFACLRIDASLCDFHQLSQWISSGAASYSGMRIFGTGPQRQPRANQASQSIGH